MARRPVLTKGVIALHIGQRLTAQDEGLGRRDRRYRRRLVVEQMPVSGVIRAAISEHIAARRRDPHFREGLEARIARARRLLDRQAGED